MNAIKLIIDLRARGVILKAQGKTLQVDAPKGVLTDAIREELRANKSEILAMIRSDAALPMIVNQITGELVKCDHCQIDVFVGQIFCDNCGARFYW